MTHFRRIPGGLAATALALLLAACGGGGDEGGLNASPGRGGLVKSPPTQLAALSAAQFGASLQATATGQQLLALAGTPTCGIDVRYLQYGTVGAQGEKTTATGAIYLPTGGSSCSGARPIVLYAHGTSVEKSYNIALLGSTTNDAAAEAGIVAATYAAQGYIVVAPNYAGYEASTLPYHPFVNADQQAKDMIDALTAARTALPVIANGTSDNGRLFITGYSQGGFVAMATHRAMQAAGMNVTASVGQSGPYAMSLFVDSIFSGHPSLIGTVFTPLTSTSWQKAYGDIYTTPSDLYTSAYVTGIDTLLPGALTKTQLIAPGTGKLPALAFLGNDVSYINSVDATTRATFYADPAQALIRTDFANAVFADIVAKPCALADGSPISPCAPSHAIRRAALANDLRNWTPAKPVLMCGGKDDPSVFFINSVQAQAYFQSQLTGPAKALTTLVDIGTDGGAADPFSPLKQGFAAALALQPDAATRTANYHTLVAPFCNRIAREFFASIP